MSAGPMSAGPISVALSIVALSLFGMSVIFALAFKRLRHEQPPETIRPNNMREQSKPVRANELPRMARVLITFSATPAPEQVLEAVAFSRRKKKVQASAPVNKAAEKAAGRAATRSRSATTRQQQRHSKVLSSTPVPQLACITAPRPSCLQTAHGI